MQGIVGRLQYPHYCHEEEPTCTSIRLQFVKGGNTGKVFLHCYYYYMVYIGTVLYKCNVLHFLARKIVTFLLMPSVSNQ